MLSPESFALALVVIFLAGTTQSLTGFGFGLVSIPLLTLFISPKLAPPIVLVDSVILNLMILGGARKLVELRRIWILMIAGLLGVPIGTWILAHWDVHSLRIYIGVVTVIAAGIFMTGFSRQVKREVIAFLPVGLLSGVMSGSINMAGPPVILFFANQNLPRLVFRANMIAYLLLLQLFAIPLLLSNGIMTRGAAISGLLLLPALLGGGFVGTFFSTRVHDQIVRTITLVIVSVAGVLSILNGLNAI